MNIRTYKDPKVKLVNFTFGYMGLYLWMKSRYEIITDLNGNKFMEQSEISDTWFTNLPDEFIVGSERVNKNEYYSRIDSMNLQYNNLEYLVFEIQGSCLFRDLLFNVNKIYQWATSNRFLFSILDKTEVYNSEHYYISSEYKDIKPWEDQFDTYMETIKKDPIVDNSRRQMPYSISSTFWIGLNRRILIEVLSFLKFRAPFFYQVYGKQLRVLSDIESSQLVSQDLPLIDQYTLGDDNFEEGVVRLNKFVHLKSKMGLILYSQFIRQTDTTIAGLYDVLEHTDVEDFKNKVFKGDTIINIQLTAHESKVRKTLTNRLCAFAMHSGDDPCSWSYVLNKLLPEDFDAKKLSELLPCKFDKNYRVINCKFHDDIKFRNEGKELSNCPCPLVSKSLSDAKIKKGRDQNKIGDAYYDLTLLGLSGGLTKVLDESHWTSQLKVLVKDADTKISDDELNEFRDTLSWLNTMFVDGITMPQYEKFPELLDYQKYALNGDFTCMMKGWAIDKLRKILDTTHDSYLISFGGDIFARNCSTLIEIEGTKFRFSGKGTYSIFTSSNRGRRGKHVSGNRLGQVSVYVPWTDMESINNMRCDIIATKILAGELNTASRLLTGNEHIFDFDESGHSMSTVYCASPFFNETQIAVRNQMRSQFVPQLVFMPDETESSKAYEVDHSLVHAVVDDNVMGIDTSDALVYPVDTDDLGTLYEVGHALGTGKDIISYLNGKYTIHVTDRTKRILTHEEKYETHYLFDCSDKQQAVSLGYFAALGVCDSMIYYELKGNKDNIMLSVRYNHVELENGEYRRYERSIDDTDF